MARFFFHIRDGKTTLDTEGSEHADLASVRQEAVEATAQILQGRLLGHSDTASWLVQVVDEAGFTVLVLSLAASVHILNTPPA